MYTMNNTLCCGRMKFVIEYCLVWDQLAQIEKYSGFQVHTPFFTSYSNLFLFMTKLLGLQQQQYLQKMLEVFKTKMLLNLLIFRCKPTTKQCISLFHFINYTHFYKVDSLQYLETWALPLSSSIFLDWILGNQFRAQNRIIQNNNSKPMKTVGFV